jgi:hypothetical protein
LRELKKLKGRKFQSKDQYCDAQSILQELADAGDPEALAQLEKL